MKKNPTWKRMKCIFFLQTCIQINKNIKMKKKHFIFITQNNNKNKKHIKKKFLKKTKIWTKFKEIGGLHSARRSRVPTSVKNNIARRTVDETWMKLLFIVHYRVARQITSLENEGRTEGFLEIQFQFSFPRSWPKVHRTFFTKCWFF